MRRFYTFAILAVATLSSMVVYSNAEMRHNLKVQTLIQEIQEQEEGLDYPITERYKYEIVEQENFATETGEDTTKIIHLEPNENKDIEITLKNIGKSSWFLTDATENQLVLGTYNPKDRESIFLDNQSEIEIKDTDGKEIISPNDTTTFELEVEAPETPGFYKEQFMPLIKNFKWLNNEKITIDFLVEGDYIEGYSYETTTEKLNKIFPQNSAKEVEIQIQNTGQTTWYSDGPYPFKLTSDSESFGSFQINMSENEVKPDETATFSFSLLSPETPGTYTIDLIPEVQGLVELDAIPYQITVADKVVALTFDDGYGDIDAFIDTLNAQDVRGTFFMLGVVAQENPEAMKRIVNEGHLLASHSYDHPDFRTLSATQIKWQLDTTRQILLDTTGYDVYPYFRYPYGAKTYSSDDVLATNGWQYYHWTNGTGDWKYHASTAAGRQHILFHATNNPPDKAVVLMHIVSESTLAVLPDIIESYRSKGYAFVTVDEL